MIEEEHATPTEPVDREARVLLVIDGAALQVVPLPSTGTLTIGRASKCDVVIDSGSVSRHHANLVIGTAVLLEDVGSSNGTFVDGGRLAANQQTKLTIGVPFLVGAVTVMVQTRTGERRDQSPPASQLAALEQSAARIAIGKLSIIVIGEHGVGKERFAERIHEMSPRRSAPFVRINCSAISEPLLEAEMFGLELPQRPGADGGTGRPGLIERADGGTVFLGEVDQLPQGLQQKLLRVMEDGEVRRTGAVAGDAVKTVDVRYIASTSKDLAAEVAAHRFRNDLYFRLAGASFTVPPLRERKDEVLPLAELFVASAAGPLGRSFVLADDAKAWLQAHDWPGNIRELRNACERAVLLATGTIIERHHLTIEDPTKRPPGQRFRSAPTIPPPVGMRFTPPPTAADMPSQVRATVAELEKQRILEALDKCAGNQTRAAEVLGISRRTLINRLDDYGIARPRKRED